MKISATEREPACLVTSTAAAEGSRGDSASLMRRSLAVLEVGIVAEAGYRLAKATSWDLRGITGRLELMSASFKLRTQQ